MAWDFSKPEKENNTKINKWDFSKPAYELAPTVPRQEVEIPAPTITPSYTPLAQMKDIARGTMPDISKMPELPAPEPSVSQKAIEALARATREAKVSPEFEKQYGWMARPPEVTAPAVAEPAVKAPDLVTGAAPVRKVEAERPDIVTGAAPKVAEPKQVTPVTPMLTEPEMSKLFRKPVKELSAGQKITEKTIQTIGDILGYIPIGTIEALRLPEIVTKFTGESPDKYKAEAENAVQQYAKVVGSIIPYFAVGGVVSGPVSGTTSSILSKVAPKLAKGFAGRVIPAVAGKAAMGGIVSTYQQAVKGLTQPEEFVLADAAKDIGTDIVRFGMFGLVSSGAGQPVREGILKALPEAMKQGAVTWNLSNLLAAAAGGSVTGATVGALDTALHYINNPEEFDRAQAMGDLLTTTLFFAGLDVLFTLKTMASPSAWNWQYGKQTGAAAKAPRPEGYKFAAHESEFKNNDVMFKSGTWNPTEEGYQEIKEGYGVWIKPGTGDQRYEMAKVGEWYVPKHEAMKKGVLDAVIKTAQDITGRPTPKVAPAGLLPGTPAEAPAVPAERILPAKTPEAVPEAIQLPEAAKEVSPEERRKSLALRAEVEQLTPEEKDEVIRDLRTAHFTDELTGLKNKAAYMADEKQPFQAFIDLDNLKWVNDNIGHGAGDTLIKTFAEALPEGAYHLSGDEFVIQGKSEEELSSFLSRLETQLGKQVVRLEGDKKSIDKKGIGFSYGIGETLDKAETELKKHKEARLAKGERAGRGEVPKGIAEKPTVSDTRVKGYVPATLNTWGQAVSVRNFDYHATKEAAEKELEELKSKIPGEVLVVKEVMAEKRVIKAEEAPKETTTVKPEAEKPAEVKAEAPIVAPKSLKNLQEQMAKVSPGKIGQEKAEALGALVKGVAAYRGLDPDEYVRQRFRGVVKGGVPAEDALFKRMESDDKNIPLEPASKEFVPPQKTVKAYKLFRTLKSHPNKIFPLFIGKTKPTPIGEWVQAEFLPTKGYAERPGWHAGVLPYAPHLMKKDGTMQEGRVWAEVELPADKDWQAIADVSKTRDIRDKVPEGGHYRFKTNKMQGDAWIIGGAIKVNRVLSPDEVRSILKEKAPEIQYKMVEGVPVASVEFDNDAKALIRALKSPNVAAMVHELGHVFRRDLTPGDLAVVEKWAGVIDGAWTKEAEEKFANGFEKYLLEGKSPTPNMKTVFEKFKQWLTEIYRNAVKLKVELSDSVRKVFDRMVGGKSIAKEEAPLSVKPKAVKPAEVKPEALKPPAKPELPKVEVEKDLPSTLKDAGFRTAEEAQLSFEAESMGLKAFKKEFPKLNKKILKQYTSAVKPEQAFKDLTDKIKNINKENLDEIKLDLQMFALKKLTPEERGQVKAFIKDTKKLLNKIPLRPEYKKEIDNLLEDVDWKVFRRTHKRIDRLEKTRDFLAKNPDAYMPKKALRELEILSKKPLADMSFSEIENMFGAVKQFARLSQLKDKLIVKQKLKETKKTVDEIGKEIETSHSPVYLKETRRADPKPSIIKQFHDLHKMVETLTFGIEGKEGGPLQKLFYNDFHAGVREETRLYNEAEDMLINVTKNYDIIPWSGFFNMRKSGIDWVKTPLKAHGKHIELTPAEVMGLYLHSKNEENKAAILEGGIKLRRYRGLGIIKVTEKQLNDTVSLLTKGQKAVADKMGEYLDTVQKDAMNKTSLLLTGNEVARVINYWRKAHPREELSLEEREMLKRYHSVRVLEDRGFLKQRTGSKAAIYLEDAFAQFVTSAKDGALYSGLAVPIRNARAILSNK